MTDQKPVPREVFMLGRYSWIDPIERVTLNRETEKTVTIGSYRRRKPVQYFETFDEAKVHAIEVAEATIEARKDQVREAEDRLKRVVDFTEDQVR